MRNLFKTLPVLAVLGLAACAGPVEAPAPMAEPAMVDPMEAAAPAVPVVCDANGNCTTPGS
ncbi:hypothetical protein AB3Y40_11470 [Yoonia sp. R2331]|uniref:hypothetical protein n=1 Tax=Yoonia sp. R2331 TaxID=3237238 RepID=UPI0034E47662